VSRLITNHICVCYLNQQRNFSASSFYPGRNDNTHVLARLNHENYTSHTPEVDDEGSETEEDLIDDDHTDELSLRHPNKFSESLAIEVSLQRSTPSNTTNNRILLLQRPSWVGSGGSEPDHSSSQSSGISLVDADGPTRRDAAPLAAPRSFAQPGLNTAVPSAGLSGE
jgi:hypothetical protein